MGPMNAAAYHVAGILREHEVIDPLRLSVVSSSLLEHSLKTTNAHALASKLPLKSFQTSLHQQREEEEEKAIEQKEKRKRKS
jgi:hypothetical protein